jgi:hypothetical protein
LAPFLRILVNNWYGEQFFSKHRFSKTTMHGARDDGRSLFPRQVFFHRRRYEGDQKIDPEDQARSQ